MNKGQTLFLLLKINCKKLTNFKEELTNLKILQLSIATRSELREKNVIIIQEFQRKIRYEKTKKIKSELKAGKWK